MKTHRITKQHLAALTLLSAFSLQPSALLAQGSLTPPGAPAPTMKTLAQIEPRTPISSAPYTISAPGSYYLTTNLTVSTGNAITIGANGVTLDLGGFTIFSTVPNATGCGVQLNSGLRNLTILNGCIQGGVTNNAGTYNGPGFGYGITYFGTPPANTRVAGISVSGCLNHGIYLYTGDSTVVESCTVRTVGYYGIWGGTIRNSVVLDSGSIAIFGDQVADCHGECSGSSHGIYVNGTAENCFGSSSDGYGLYAATALNSSGASSSGIGLHGGDMAQNCNGISSSGLGLDCPGTAQNCYGQSSSSQGLLAIVAIGCRGWSASGTGLSATIANSCIASSVIATYKYNMP